MLEADGTQSRDLTYVDDIARGTCESQNGRIRHYLPKGTDLALVSYQQLAAYQESQHPQKPGSDHPARPKRRSQTHRRRRGQSPQRAGHGGHGRQDRHGRHANPSDREQARSYAAELNRARVRAGARRGAARESGALM